MPQDSGSNSATIAIVLGVVIPIAVLVLLCLVLLVIGALLFSRFSKPKEQWLINFDELELDHKVGAGAFGEVFKGKWKGSEVAVKVNRKEELSWILICY